MEDVFVILEANRYVVGASRDPSEAGRSKNDLIQSISNRGNNCPPRLV